MIPLLHFELVWKAIYLPAFALPMWSEHQITGAAKADITSVLMVIVFLPMIPWRHVWRQYVVNHGER